MTSKGHKKHSLLAKPQPDTWTESNTVKGIVLAGGESRRMGQDKSEIHYRGLSQKEYTFELLKKFCDEVFISVKKKPDETFPYLEDSFINLGPYGGILSAFRYDPNSAWLTVAVDIPLLKTEDIAALIKGRDKNKIATCFHNPETNFPEPLITLWEPAAYPVLLEYLAKGYSCPRKVLINSDVKEIQTDNPDALFNANTPEDMKQVLSKLNA